MTLKCPRCNSSHTETLDYGQKTGATVGFVGGAFVQDDWQPVDRLTLNLGMRLDGEVLYADQAQAATKVYSAIMPAPRTGLAWDITGDSKNVMTVNYGRYYDVSGTVQVTSEAYSGRFAIEQEG